MRLRDPFPEIPNLSVHSAKDCAPHGLCWLHNTRFNRLRVRLGLLPPLTKAKENPRS